MIGATVVQRALAHPRMIDWLPVFVVAPVLMLDAAFSSLGKPLTPVSVPLAFVSCLPLVLRRHLAFPRLAPLLVGGVVLVLWQLHPTNTCVLIPMIALFELALNGDRRRSLWMSLALVPCVVISVVPFASGAAHIAGIVIRNLALCLLAIAFGDILRSRRVATRQAVAAAEQSTLRRVADERLRIAREIHDVVAHAMTAINVQAGVAAHLLERDPGQAYGALRDIKRTSGEALGELRHTLNVLREPAQAEAAPTHPAATLHDLEPLTGGLRSAGVAVELDVEPLADVPAAVHSAGYRIVQEALTNVARHAHASSARVCVHRVNGTLRIEVSDDGTAGSGTGAAPGAGNGVRGMRERAAALGGTLEAAPARDGGWRVAASLPVAGQPS
jgi:signal transduction histidine kinase